jgi:hypothetical protein
MMWGEHHQLHWSLLQLKPITTWYKVGTWYRNKASGENWFLVSVGEKTPTGKLDHVTVEW